MSKAQRDKGLLGERQVRHEFEAGGFEVRGLEGEGDNLAIGHGLTFHVETKRQETLAMDKWSRQAEAECPFGTIPIVVYRRSREPWRVSIRLEDLLAVLNKS